MKLPKYLFVFIHCVVLFLFIAGNPFYADAQSNPVYKANTKAELIPQYTVIREGQSFYVGLSLTPDKNWHTYWRNPGESGLAPSIKWQLPLGFEAEDIKWPKPEKIVADSLVTFGYHGESFLLSKINVPAEFEINGDLVVSAKVNWLSCEVVCVPGVAHFNLRIPIAAESSEVNPHFQEKYNKYKYFYHNRDVPGSMKVVEKEEEFFVVYKPSQFIHGMDSVQYFPYDSKVIDITQDINYKVKNNRYEFRFKKSPHYQKGEYKNFRGIFVFDKENRTELLPLEIDVPIQDKVSVGAAIGKQSGSINSIWIALIFAFLGGIILNLMPCVLPVLSIKVLSLIEKSKEDSTNVFDNGIQFTLGILTSFWFLAGGMLILRFAGKQIGWGFQFQSPLFVIGMSILFFWLALSLFGVFEIGTKLTQVKSSDHAFLNGVLATIVATPCTAPFMGSAVGFALTKPPIFTFLIFTALGLGMALPYLILTRFPALMKFIPKPGIWMEYLKQFFGFVLMGVVIWLCWVLSIQNGSDAVILLLIALLLMGMGCWVFTRPGRGQKAFVLCLILWSIATWMSFKAAQLKSMTVPTVGHVAQKGIPWKNYSQEVLQSYLASDKPIFLDFTAAWCLSCQVNERAVFHNKKVISRFDELGVVPIKVDWTNYDPEVTQLLNSFGKNSIPLYVMYPSDKSKQPHTLPEIITPDIVLNAMNKYFVE